MGSNLYSWQGVEKQKLKSIILDVSPRFSLSVSDVCSGEGILAFVKTVDVVMATINTLSVC